MFKYNLRLVAANFFVTTFKPCVEAASNALDPIEPQYVVDAVNRAHLPIDPFATQSKL